MRTSDNPASMSPISFKTLVESTILKSEGADVISSLFSSISSPLKATDLTSDDGSAATAVDSSGVERCCCCFSGFAGGGGGGGCLNCSGVPGFDIGDIDEDIDDDSPSCRARCC